jgi:hypothetical protein
MSEENPSDILPSKEDFEKLLNDGKKSQMLGDLAEAADSLGEAAGMSAEIFGDFAPETFEPHFLYGKVLLKLASMETDLMQGKNDDEEMDPNGLLFPFNYLTNYCLDPILGSIKEHLQKTVGELATVTEKVAEGEFSKNAPAEIDIEQTVDEEEDVDRAQLVWEVLDYARAVCSK